MKKYQLENKIKELEEEQVLKNAIIEKLLRDFIVIKPLPKGKIKERIVVFIEPVVLTDAKIHIKNMFFLQTLEVRGQSELIIDHHALDN